MQATTIFGLVVVLGLAAFSTAATSVDAPAKSSSKAVTPKEIERGKYLVMITGCNDSHTPGFLTNGGKSPEKDWLTGGVLGWRGPWGTT